MRFAANALSRALSLSLSLSLALSLSHTLSLSLSLFLCLSLALSFSIAGKGERFVRFDVNAHSVSLMASLRKGRKIGAF